MKCALLCTGPSLADRHDFADYPLVVAVNRAVLHAPASAWVALDWKTVTRIDAPPCVLYTSADGKAMLTPARWPRVGEFDVRVTEHRGLTAISALYVARELGATAIDVFGADWTDAPDWDGARLIGTERDGKRWEREAAMWSAAVADIKPIEVTRMTKQPTEEFPPEPSVIRPDPASVAELQNEYDFAVQMASSGSDNKELVTKHEKRRDELAQRLEVAKLNALRVGRK